MSDLFWLSAAQMARLEPYFPKSYGKPRVDDRRVLSGIILINRNGLRWRDAPREYGSHKTLYNRWKRWSDSISVPFCERRWHRTDRPSQYEKTILSVTCRSIHQIGAVIRFREYRPGENASWPPGTGTSAQPLPHKPRKQRKNPAAAGSGEQFRKGKWRRGWTWYPTFSGRPAV